jgi:Ricin-type beta-trefoil lectin domain-like
MTGRWSRTACWALERDQAGTANDLDRYRRVNTSDYPFYEIMAAVETSTQPVNGAFPAGTYTIVSAFDNKCVDIHAASTANSAQVQQFACNGTGAQSFQVITVDPDCQSLSWQKSPGVSRRISSDLTDLGLS